MIQSCLDAEHFYLDLSGSFFICLLLLSGFGLFICFNKKWQISGDTVIPFSTFLLQTCMQNDLMHIQGLMDIF